MKLIFYGIHKSGTVFLENFFKKIAEEYKINFYSENFYNNLNEYDNDNSDNKIKGAIRFGDDYIDFFSKTYNSSSKYIFHYRNPMDIFISQYFNFKYENSNIHSQNYKELTLLEFIKLSGNIIEKNHIYNYLLDIIDNTNNNTKYNNVFLSNYDTFFYDFESWANEVFLFLELIDFSKNYDIIQKFIGDFKNNKNKQYEKIQSIDQLKKHKRSGLSKQYLKEFTTTELLECLALLDKRILTFFYPDIYEENFYYFEINYNLVDNFGNKKQIINNIEKSDSFRINIESVILPKLTQQHIELNNDIIFKNEDKTYSEEEDIIINYLIKKYRKKEIYINNIYNLYQEFIYFCKLNYYINSSLGFFYRDFKSFKNRLLSFKSEKPIISHWIL